MASYTEDHLVEQPAIQLIQHELGWDVMNCFGEPSSQELRRSGWEVPGKAEMLKTEKLKRSKAIDGAVEEMRRANSWVLFALEPVRQCNRLIMNEFLFEWKTSA
jgi:hypothetical protein